MRAGDVLVILALMFVLFLPIILALSMPISNYEPYERPCVVYGDTSLKDVPARCVEYWSTRGEK